MRTRGYDGSASVVGALATVANNAGQNLSPSSYTTDAARALIPGTTISAIVKLYTVPVGYQAFYQYSIINGGAAGSTVSIFVMNDSATTPVATDRISTTAVGANATATTAGSVLIDEGGSIWAFSSVNNDTSILPNIQLYKKPILGGTYTTLNTKQIQSDGTDVLQYTSVGYTVGGFSWLVSNTTGGAIIYQLRCLRAADGITYTVIRQSVAANGTAVQTGTNFNMGPGDKLYWSAPSTGLNFFFVALDRPTV